MSSQTSFSFNSLLDSQESLKPIILTSVFITIKEHTEEKHGPEPGKSIPEVKPQCGGGEKGRGGGGGRGEGFVLLAWNPANVGNVLEDHQTGVLGFHDVGVCG